MSGVIFGLVMGGWDVIGVLLAVCTLALLVSAHLLGWRR